MINGSYDNNGYDGLIAVYRSDNRKLCGFSC